MTLLLSMALGSAALVLALPALSDLLSLAVAAMRRPPPIDPVGPSGSPGRRLLLLVPAHDEELLIEECIRSLLAQEPGSGTSEVVVVADNCTDGTAAVARRAGAEVLERTDAVLRGKPRAIAWALGQLDMSRYDAFAIIDADCVVNARFVHVLCGNPRLRDVLTQPFIGVHNEGETAITRLATLYSHANNGLAFDLKSRAGLNVPVGAGLCMGTDLLARQGGWTAFSICEDWEIYAQLTAQGEDIERAPGAVLLAQEAKGLRQGRTQRARWMAGKVDVLRDYGWKIVGGAKVGFRQKLDAMAELLSLGPMTNAALAVGVVVAAFLLPPAPRLVVMIAASSGIVRQGTYTVLALARAEERFVYLRAFAFLPVYAVWRLATAIGTAVRPPGSRWVRADRHAFEATDSDRTPPNGPSTA